ncbi:MAG: histidinol phosphate phosphatase domain-containing protein [Desulfonatronovibrionaceae bacterium]
MIDLHTHTVYSDGELIPAELARRAKAAGYRAMAFTDHVDHSNIEHILAALSRLVHDYSLHAEIELLAGVELTHVPPPLIPDLVQKARDLGAQLVIVHGETIVEPVVQGTNHAAIMSGADILAHPGLISAQDAGLAAENNVLLEITTRKGHALTNGHVLAMAREHGAGLVINNDAHAPGDLVDRKHRQQVALGAGMTEQEIIQAEKNAQHILAAAGKTSAE